MSPKNRDKDKQYWLSTKHRKLKMGNIDSIINWKCTEKLSSSYHRCGTYVVTQGNSQNSVIRGNEQKESSTMHTDPGSSMRQILCSDQPIHHGDRKMFEVKTSVLLLRTVVSNNLLLKSSWMNSEDWPISLV